MKTQIKTTCLFLFLSAIVGCSPRVTSHLNATYGPLPEDEAVVVLPLGSTVPASAEALGDVAIKDSGFTTRKNGTYAAVIELAKQEARQAGGNVLVLTDHRLPDYVSTIHRIQADVYRVDSADDVQMAMTSPVESSAPADSVATEESVPEEIVAVKPPKTFMIGIWGGGGYRTSRLDPQLTGAEREYMSAMRWGLDYGADAIYYMGGWGLGLRYSSFRAHHCDNASFTTSDGVQRSGMVDSTNNIWFLGPVMALRDTYNEKGNSVSALYGIGYLGDKMIEEVPSYYPVTARGGTVGFLVELGADFRITEHAFFSVALSYYRGTLYRYRVRSNSVERTVDLGVDNGEGLNYLALNFGLHWYLGK